MIATYTLPLSTTEVLCDMRLHGWIEHPLNTDDVVHNALRGRAHFRRVSTIFCF